nr:alpha-galactosidase [uncultured Gemmiger sp.]
MGIQFDAGTRTFTLQTVHTTYQMRVDERGRLLHLYYGRSIGQGDLGALYPPADHGFSPNYYTCRNQRGISPDTLPQEYTGCNVGDFRLSCLVVRDESGAAGADFLYDSHTIVPGKYTLEGLPCAHDEGSEAETLCIRMKDPVTGLQLELLYGVFAKQDMLTRAVRLTNTGKGTLRLEKAASLCLDLPFGNWDLIHFHGRHAMERQMQRVSLPDAITTVSSTRGASSHHHNPFVILCDHDATEDNGLCYGVMPVYSGSHRTDIEVDQNGLTRVVSGLHEERFSWQLDPDQTFTAPEVLLCCTPDGLGELSRHYHNFLRRNICRSPFRYARRPVLINNWEATYFNFTTESICRIAEKAASLGVEMMVLDDGWFGKRNDDNSGLGDWFVNEEKLPGGLRPLIERVNALGMKFGIWVEPEMVSEDSDLYRAHPDWALTLPGRSPVMGRNQLVLDLGRPEVVDYLAERLSTLLRENHIEYVKWDMNRNMSDVYSRALPPERQGETSHRYMLGVYSLLDRLTTQFPDVLFEGCAGGGGRFDAGMLCYFPQIWCSDDTDAIERLSIQYGTSFGYPVSAMGAHVSACPNHQTGRTVPLWTRAVVAMSGTFGYELDLGRLTDEECDQVRQQIETFKRYYDVIQNGAYYRLTAPDRQSRYAAWQTVTDKESLVSLVLIHPEANARPLHLCLRGLDPAALYRIDEVHMYGTAATPEVGAAGGTGLCGAVVSGSTLLYAGYTLPQLTGDAPSVQMHLTRIS